MRVSLLILPLAMIAAPALAQGQPQPPVRERIEIPAELTSPQTAERLGDMMQVLSKVFLDIPVGELKAAAEGRPATEADKRTTIRDMGRRDDPNFDRNFERQMAETRPMIQSSMKALSQALPAMLEGLSEAGEAMERAVANMPRPDYPKR